MNEEIIAANVAIAVAIAVRLEKSRVKVAITASGNDVLAKKNGLVGGHVVLVCDVGLEEGGVRKAFMPMA